MTRRTFRLFVNVSSEAFQPDPTPELVRILRDCAKRIEGGEFYGHYLTIHDVNGNDVGRFAVKTEQDN